MHQRSEKVDKDELKKIVKDLRSKGLSFRAISKTLIETYGVDLSHVSVREILKRNQETTKEEVQIKNDKIAPEENLLSELRLCLNKRYSNLRQSSSKKKSQWHLLREKKEPRKMIQKETRNILKT